MVCLLLEKQLLASSNIIRERTYSETTESILKTYSILLIYIVQKSVIINFLQKNRTNRFVCVFACV
jgi:hypothetical protein